MNVLEKILEATEKESKLAHEEMRRCASENHLQFDEIKGYVRACETILEIIRSYIDEAANMSGKRLIDANALDDEVMNFFLAITGNPKQTTVVRECKESFRRMIDEQPTIYADDGWIPVSKRLPEPDKMVVVTVHCSEWISDYDSVWVSEDEKIHHSEEYLTSMGYVVNDLGDWAFFDRDGYEIPCDKEFGKDKGDVYSVVTAWRPFEELKPYKGGE